MAENYLLPVILAPEKDIRGGRPSASGLERLALCPGSWQLESRCPVESRSDAAAQGTRLHAHLENGTTPEDAEEAEAVAWCRETELKIVHHLFPSGARVMREVRWWSDDGIYSGQADAVYTDGVTALVLDYKFGRIAVEEPARNWQLQGLAVLAFEKLGVQAVVVGILQPFVSRLMPTLRQYGRADFPTLMASIAAVIADAEKPGAPLHPGEKQCRYCKAAASCPALRLTVRDVVNYSLRDWQNFTPEVKRQAYDLAKLAQKWAESVMGRVGRDLDAGREVSRLSRGKDIQKFEVSDIKKAFQVLTEAGVSADAFVSCCKLTLGDLDKAFLAAMRTRNPKMRVDDAKIALRDLLSLAGEKKNQKGRIKEN